MTKELRYTYTLTLFIFLILLNVWEASEILQVTNQKQSSWTKHLNEDLVQIDLGKVKSLKESEISIDKVDFENLPSGSQIVDENTNTKSDFNLILVGRKLSKAHYFKIKP